MTEFIETMKNLMIFKIVISIILILFSWILLSFIMGYVHKKTEDIHRYYKIKKILKYINFTFIFIILIGIWSDKTTSISTYMGLLTAGIAIALKDIILNIAAWLFIIWKKSFEIGDRVSLGDITGDVIDLGIFQFSVMEVGNWINGEQSTGRIIHIPNYKVLSEPMANYTTGFKYIWNEIIITVTFESDWQKAKKILSDITNKHVLKCSKLAEEELRKASKKYVILYNKLTPIVYTSVVGSGINLTIRYLCETRKRRTTSEKMWEDILREFKNHDDIDLAYSTQRLIIDNL